MNVRISMVTPCYNPGILLKELADCVAGQTLADFEWVIVDDGSDAETLAILSAIESRNDLNVKVVRGNHQGGNACRNLGARTASGTHIKYLDADDYMDLTLLQYQFETATEHPQAIIVSPTVLVKPDGSSYRLPMPPAHSSDVLGDYLYESWSHHCACLIPKSLVDAVGGWGENLRYGQDLEFMRRLLMSSGPAVIIENRAAFYYRQHDLTNRVSTARADVSGKYKAQMQILDDLAKQLESEGRLSNKYRQLIARNYDRWACSAVMADSAMASTFMARAQNLSGGHYPIYGGPVYRGLRKVLGFSTATRVVNSTALRSLRQALSSIRSKTGQANRP